MLFTIQFMLIIIATLVYVAITRKTTRTTVRKVRLPYQEVEVKMIFIESTPTKPIAEKRFTPVNIRDWIDNDREVQKLRQTLRTI